MSSRSLSVILHVYPMHLKVQFPMPMLSLREMIVLAISNVLFVTILTDSLATSVLILPTDFDCGVWYGSKDPLWVGFGLFCSGVFVVQFGAFDE